jgi:UDP-2,3-diacylglucosamine pyrophosphatase LpxH
MTDFQIVSDLHIEYKNDCLIDPLTLITPSSNILIMAGDIGSFYKYYQLKYFLEIICKEFKIVLYVPGNSEYYKTLNHGPLGMKQLFENIIKINENIPNLYVLNQSSVKIGEYCFAGTTLWSHLEIPLPKYIVRIHDMDTQMYTEFFNKDIKYIDKMINYCQQNDLKLIMITHYGPTFKILEGVKKKKKFESLYANNLDHLLYYNKVHTWICGHVHKNFDFVTNGGTRIVGNQKGKPKDNIIDYKHDFVIKL